MSSISALKAKATHDAAMDIIAKETRERAAKTEHLRQLRLAAEAQTGTTDRIAVPRVKTPLAVRA
ncbi:MAG: hypothetical protein AB7F09_02100, partial [Parvibaculaceae bacterium]